MIVTVGCFDLLHEGHINLLTYMASKGQVLIFLHDDKSIFKNKGRFPVQAYEQRERNLYSCGLVNAVIKIRRTDPSHHLHDARDSIELYVRGDDWLDFPGHAQLNEDGILIKFISYTADVSSSQIRDSL